MKSDKNPETIQTMFNMISEKYDFINNVISFGTQKCIKKRCIKLLDIKPNSNVVDLCCGTGDLAYLIKRQQPKASVMGIDFSENMIEIAKDKVKGVNFFLGDATALPFPDNTFDFVTMGFGLRNIQNAEKAIEEVYRILKPNGEFLHLDFGEKNIISFLFDKFVPVTSGLFSNNSYAYRYLINSKKMFLSPNELIKDFESKGFKLKQRKDFIFKIISCQIMKKYS